MFFRKKLIEVAFPSEIIYAASMREKTIRHGRSAYFTSLVV